MPISLRLQRKQCISMYRCLPLILLALAACREEGPDLSACGADELQELVGSSPDVMGMLDFPDNARILGPDIAATTDFVPDRLNITFDENSVITQVSCG